MACVGLAEFGGFCICNMSSPFFALSIDVGDLERVLLLPMWVCELKNGVMGFMFNGTGARPSFSINTIDCSLMESKPSDRLYDACSYSILHPTPINESHGKNLAK